jgi:hypothetical protein
VAYVDVTVTSQRDAPRAHISISRRGAGARARPRGARERPDRGRGTASANRRTTGHTNAANAERTGRARPGGRRQKRSRRPGQGMRATLRPTCIAASMAAWCAAPMPGRWGTRALWLAIYERSLHGRHVHTRVLPPAGHALYFRGRCCTHPPTAARESAHKGLVAQWEVTHSDARRAAVTGADRTCCCESARQAEHVLSERLSHPSLLAVACVPLLPLAEPPSHGWESL